MCGFAGFLGEAVSPEGSSSLLAAMADAIAHRGPDGRGAFAVPGLGLAHVRLSIVCLADGPQPMAREDGQIVIVFTGAVFTYVELVAGFNGRRAAGARWGEVGAS